jgi:uncharacterized membrane protein YdjX (TVP38/TMEM64 family)
MTPDMRRRITRLAILAALIIAVLIVAEVTGLRGSFTIARLRTLTLAAGSFGVLLYVAAFIVGEIIHVPGLLFVAAGVAIWGRLWGGVISWAASVLALSATFLVVRAIGGRALDGLKHPWLDRMLVRLADAPIRTVALLRAVLVISPPVTYALAFSPVRFSDFFIGSAIGLVAPLALAALFFERILRYFGS